MPLTNHLKQNCLRKEYLQYFTNKLIYLIIESLVWIQFELLSKKKLTAPQPPFGAYRHIPSPFGKNHLRASILTTGRQGQCPSRPTEVIKGTWPPQPLPILPNTSWPPVAPQPISLPELLTKPSPSLYLHLYVYPLRPLIPRYIKT